MKKLIIGIIVGMVAMIAGVAYANSSYFAVHTPTATATTSPTYMTAGAATTTLDVNAAGGSNKIDSALIVFQVKASTTQAQQLGMKVQYSLNNIDWYAQTEATSTTNAIAGEKEYRFVLATSTDQLTATSGTLTYRIHKSIPIETPTPYVRVQFFVPVGQSPLDIWADYQPIKQIQ